MMTSTADIPPFLKLEVARGCNLRCPHCNVADRGRLIHARDYGVMSLETFSMLADYLPRFRSVGFDMKGEPLLNPRLEQMVEACHRAGCETMFTSNMMLLTEKRARSFIEAGLDALNVSIDGVAPGSFARSRVGAELEPFCDKVRMVRELKRRLGTATPHLGAVFVSNRDNVNELPGLVRLAHELGLESIAVNGTEPYEERFADTVLYRLDGTDPGVTELFAEVRQLAEACGIPLELPPLVPVPERICEIPRWVVSISWKGDVHPCYVLTMGTDFYRFGRKMRHEVVRFGNVREGGLAAVFAYPDFRAFREAVARNEMPGACDGCLIRTGVICR